MTQMRASAPRIVLHPPPRIAHDVVTPAVSKDTEQEADSADDDDDTQRQKVRHERLVQEAQKAEDDKKGQCERWAYTQFPTRPRFPVYFLTDDYSIKTLYTETRAVKREPIVEYEYVTKTRRVYGPNERLKLEEGEWELAEVKVKRVKRI